MTPFYIRVKRIHEDAELPFRGSSQASGYDLYAYLPKYKDTDLVIDSGETVEIPTGIAVEIPEGFEMQLRPRSSMRKRLLVDPGGVATFDSDFRGEVTALLHNFNSREQRIRHGDRIVQAVFARHETALIEVVDELSDTERGAGAFGSTNKKSHLRKVAVAYEDHTNREDRNSLKEAVRGLRHLTNVSVHRLHDKDYASPGLLLIDNSSVESRTESLNHAMERLGRRADVVLWVQKGLPIMGESKSLNDGNTLLISAGFSKTISDEALVARLTDLIGKCQTEQGYWLAEEENDANS